MSLDDKLKSLGVSLPEISSPGGNYLSVNIRSKMVFVAIQFPILNGKLLYQGRLGENISTDEGYKAMELCALNVLSQIQSKVGFEKLEGLNHIEGFYRSKKGWDNAPKVVNGASDLFLTLLEEKGRHSRAILGVENLPRNFSVGLTASFTLL